jgi:NADH-quinone oxidoreductase subunit M
VTRLPWITITVFLPVAGAAVMVLFGSIGRMAIRGRVEARVEREAEAARWWALLVSVATFGTSVAILTAFRGGTSGLQLVERASWVGPLNFQYVVGVDGISVFMVLLTTFLMPLSVLASWRLDRQVPYLMASLLLLETAMLGAFVALDLLLFFVFFEGLLFPMYLLIGVWGSGRRVYAAVKFFLFTMAGSALLLVAILFLYFRAGSVLGQPSFVLEDLARLDLPVATARWLFVAFFLAFAVKVPLFPLHTWLPDAHTEAPTAGSVILAGVLLKVGAYGLIRFNLALFPEASSFFREAILVLAAIGVVYGAVVALIQTDVKRLVAYSSVSHLGFVVLGIFAGTAQGMSGGVLQMVNHGLSTGALFLIVGMLYERTHTRELGRLGGLGSRTPVLAGFFLVVALSSLALPGLNGFVGEFLVLVGTFAVAKPYAVVAAAGIVLSAIYLLWAYQRVMHGDLRVELAETPDASGREVAILAPVLVLIVAIGVYPRPFLERIGPDAEVHAEILQVEPPAPAVRASGEGG